MHADKAPLKIDNGLLRLGEAEEVRQNLTQGLGIQLTVVDARQRFLYVMFSVKTLPIRI